MAGRLDGGDPRAQDQVILGQGLRYQLLERAACWLVLGHMSFDQSLRCSQESALQALRLGDQLRANRHRGARKGSIPQPTRGWAGEPDWSPVQATSRPRPGPGVKVVGPSTFGAQKVEAAPDVRQYLEDI